MDCTKWIIILLLAMVSIPAAFAVGMHHDSPIGYWKAIDDATGQPNRIVQIWKTEDQILMGKVVKIFSNTNSEKSKFCTACTGNKHNQPLVGMVVMSGLKMHKNQWKMGQILDTDNGKIYHCALKLTEKGNKLNVKGYLGLPWFGRSQTWERVDLMSG